MNSEVSTPRSHPPYPSEFKAEAVRLYHTSGRSLQKVANDLGVTNNSLREWVRRAEVEDSSREGLTQNERDELNRLRRENRILKEEREIQGSPCGMTEHLQAELVIKALEMVVWNRQLSPGLVHHSDHGSQYTFLAFGQRLEKAHILILGSMGTVGDALDNAVAEGFFATLQIELLDR